MALFGFISVCGRVIRMGSKIGFVPEVRFVEVRFVEVGWVRFVDVRFVEVGFVEV